jgi:Ca2+-binding RTX toxin-like protein
MATRIRRAGLLATLALLLMATALAGAAWAANAIRCAPSGATGEEPLCEGTARNDVMYGTNKADWMQAGSKGADTLYGRGGDDDLVGGVGPDKVRGGPGDDFISNEEADYPFGQDENHGGPGNDYIVGHLSPEKHFGGRGNDKLVDYNFKARDKNPDYFRCGPGRDEVSYHKGLDRVADDCEVLHPAPY